MCGIVGYVGERSCRDILFRGLRKLEYRGYDSAGISILADSGFQLLHAVGNLDNLFRQADILIQGQIRGVDMNGRKTGIYAFKDRVEAASMVKMKGDRRYSGDILGHSRNDMRDRFQSDIFYSPFGYLYYSRRAGFYGRLRHAQNRFQVMDIE